MSSLDTGKKEVCEWIRANFPHGASCLDVGACDGKWAHLVGDHLDMDAVEIFPAYVRKYNLKDKYRAVYLADIRGFSYDHYDLIIFGDVIEHMNVPEAQKVLDYAYERCDNMIVAVPYQWEQGAIRHNPHEIHVQNDLTHELFMERYKGLVPLFKDETYGYYIKGET